MYVLKDDSTVNKDVEIKILNKVPEETHKTNEIFFLKVEGAANYEILKKLRDVLHAKDALLLDKENGKNNKLSRDQPTMIINTADSSIKNQTKNQLNKKTSLLSRTESVEK